jgi:hypothetical protein
MSMPGQDPAGIDGLVRRSEVLIDLHRYDEAIQILREAAARGWKAPPVNNLRRNYTWR